MRLLRSAGIVVVIVAHNVVVGERTPLLVGP